MARRAPAPAAASRVEVRVHTGRTVINLRAFGPDLADGFVQAGLPAPPGNNQWLDQVNSLYWLGPDEWLLVCPGPGDVPDGLAMAASEGQLTVNEQSGGWVLLSLLGPASRPLLERGCTLNLDPARMGRGQCAQTLLAKAPVLLATHANPDQVSLCVRRSFAEYVALWLARAGEVDAIGYCFDPPRTNPPERP
jgi:heterotetrameric sarcosine oxidase gamma subunit